jgi:hypothetical protein
MPVDRQDDAIKAPAILAVGPNARSITSPPFPALEHSRK